MTLAQTLNSLKTRYSQHNRQALRNPWVLAWLGIVVVFFAVNLLFIVLAAVSSPGLVVEDYYEQGRVYEQHTLQLLAARERLHWQTSLQLPQRIVSGRSALYQFHALDRYGMPIGERAAVFKAYRPSRATEDFTLPLHYVAPGWFEVEATLDLPGVWDLTVEISHGDTAYQHNQRVFAQAP